MNEQTEFIEGLATHIVDFSINKQDYSVLLQLESKDANIVHHSGFAPLYGLPNLSASFLNCSACSLSNLARSNASACFLLRYSKSITESVRT